MKKKKLNLNRVIIAALILLGIILITTLVIKVYFDFLKKPTDIKVEKNLDSIELYGYTLKESDTKIYKTYYEELREELKEKEIDYEKYAELLTKLFVIDFYTLRNKLTSTDIGSLEFIHPKQVENFKLNAGSTIYKYIENNIHNNRQQELPEVKDVSIKSIKETKYEVSAKEYEAYDIEVSWEYVKDLDYDSSKNFILIRDKNILYVVEGYND